MSPRARRLLRVLGLVLLVVVAARAADIRLPSILDIGARPDAAEPAAEGIPDAAQAGVVEKIVDGDTIWVRVDDPGGPLAAAATHKIRLLEIDTPETQHPDLPVQCGGPEATRFAEQLLPVGSTVHLLADQEDTDQYGRFLRYAWTEDGRFYNLEAVRAGVARAVLFEPNDAYIATLRKAETQARAAGRGLWGPPCHGRS